MTPKWRHLDVKANRFEIYDLDTGESLEPCRFEDIKAKLDWWRETARAVNTMRRSFVPKETVTYRTWPRRAR